MAEAMHFLTIELGNWCGRPSTEPDGGRATSDPAEVTCRACQQAIMAQVDPKIIDDAAQERAEIDAPFTIHRSVWRETDHE